jgi:hypothetical protein
LLKKIVWVPEEMGKLFYDLGHAIAQDDRKDIGQFGRIHHWQVGTFMMFLGGVCERVAVAKQKYANGQLQLQSLKPANQYLRT